MTKLLALALLIACALPACALNPPRTCRESFDHWSVLPECAKWGERLPKEWGGA